MIRYINVKYSYTETLDELDSRDFSTTKEFYKELNRLVREYNFAGIPAYKSQRCTKEWKK